MIKVALTGNIASGKTTVQRFIENCGFKVLDTDICAHEILEKSDELKVNFKAYDVFNSDGSFDRTKLGKLVFDNPELKVRLENIIHPKIKKNIINFFEINKDEKACFVAIPLLYEVGFQDMFDKVVLIYTDDDIRKKRLIERNGYSDEYAQKRINAQISQDKKVDIADYVVKNNENKESLELSVKELLSKLCVL